MGIDLLRVPRAICHSGLRVLLGVLGNLLLLVRLVPHHHTGLRLRGVLGIRRRSRSLLSHGTLWHRSIVLLLRRLWVIRLVHLLRQRLLRVLTIHAPLVVTRRRGDLGGRV